MRKTQFSDLGENPSKSEILDIWEKIVSENKGFMKIKIKNTDVVIGLSTLYSSNKKNVCYWSFIDGDTFKKLTGIRTFKQKPPTIRIFSPGIVSVFDADVNIKQIDARLLTIL